MLQSGDEDEIVWPVNQSVRDFIISRGRLFHNMVNVISFPGLSNIILKLFEPLRPIEIGFDKWIFVVKPRGGFRRRFQRDDKLSLRSKSGARQRARQPRRGKLQSRANRRRRAWAPRRFIKIAATLPSAKSVASRFAQWWRARH
jgi:hypothetical protein